MGHKEQIVAVFRDYFEAAHQEVCFRDSSASDFTLVAEATTQMLAAKAYDANLCSTEIDRRTIVAMVNQFLNTALDNHAADAARQPSFF